MNVMTMDMVFTNSHSTPLFSNSWTPNSAGSYAGTCIFLVVLAIILRCLYAAKVVLEHRWLAQARNRRFVLVRGKDTEASRIDRDADAKVVSLVTANGVEENVKVITATGKQTIPFRLSVDLPRAALVTVMAGVGYLL